MAAGGGVSISIYIQWDKGRNPPDCVVAFLRRLENQCDDLHRNNAELDNVDLSGHLHQKSPLHKKFLRRASRGVDDEPEVVQR